jgi:outer membrane autotransporter protein
LTINGSCTQTATGSLNVELGDTGPGQYDQLVISGQARFDGTLNVSLLNGYVPAVGDALQVLNFASSSDAFATANGLGVGNGVVFILVYDPTDLTPSAVPV